MTIRVADRQWHITLAIFESVQIVGDYSESCPSVEQNVSMDGHYGQSSKRYFESKRLSARSRGSNCATDAARCVSALMVTHFLKVTLLHVGVSYPRYVSPMQSFSVSIPRHKSRCSLSATAAVPC